MNDTKLSESENTILQTLEGFIGQERLKARLEVAIKGAQRRGETLGHILLIGQSDSGKSTMAKIVSQLMQAKVVHTNGLALENIGDVAGVLTSFEEGDFLLIEDVHMLDKSIAEFLSQSMKDFNMSITIDRGPNARIVTLNLPRFTVIATATRTERIPTAFMSSFEIIEEMATYSEGEFASLASRFATVLGFELEGDAPFNIVRSMCVSPRDVLNRTRHVQDYAQLRGQIKSVSADLAVQAMKMLRQAPYKKENV